MLIDMNKKYTSDGKPIRILCTDRFSVGGYTVLGIFNDGTVMFFKGNGKYPDSKCFNLVEVWEPQSDEWCLFWDNDESKTAVLSKFVGTSESGLFKDCGYSSWQYCAKFTGELPEHLKEL
jgi:hypothetical protein